MEEWCGKRESDQRCWLTEYTAVLCPPGERGFDQVGHERAAQWQAPHQRASKEGPVALSDHASDDPDPLDTWGQTHLAFGSAGFPSIDHASQAEAGSHGGAGRI